MTDDSVVDIVDLFAGPGGWDVAAQHLGLAVTGIENDHCACETRRAAGLGTVEGDVRDYSPADFPTATDLIGSPPCQPYSIGGKGAGRRALDTVLHFASLLAARKDIRSGLATLDDERTGLVLEPLRWVLAALDAGHPYRTVMLEQVPTVLPVWDAMAQILRTEGYTVVTGRLRAEEYGVPQTRVRAILVARRGDGAALPAPTHRRYSRNTAQDAGDPELQPWVSMAQALGWGMTHRPALTVAVGTAAERPRPLLRRRLREQGHPVRGTRRRPLDRGHPTGPRRFTARLPRWPQRHDPGVRQRRSRAPDLPTRPPLPGPPHQTVRAGRQRDAAKTGGGGHPAGDGPRTGHAHRGTGRLTPRSSPGRAPGAPARPRPRTRGAGAAPCPHPPPRPANRVHSSRLLPTSAATRARQDAAPPSPTTGPRPVTKARIGGCADRGARGQDSGPRGSGGCRPASTSRR